MISLLDLLHERAERNKKYFENPLYYSGLIKKKASEIFGEKNVKVFLFGSIVKGNYTLSSDIDVLVVAPIFQPENGAGIITYLLNDFEFATPFNILLCNPAQYINWFKKYILDKYIEVE